MKIGIDLDGTICNTIEVVYGRFAVKASKPVLAIYNLSKFGATTSFFKMKWVYRKAKPYRGAAKVLMALVARGFEPVYITARPEELRAVTNEWLIAHSFPEGKIVMGRNKVQVVMEEGVAIMFEDSPHEILPLRTVTNVIVLNRPYNSELEGVVRVKSWLEIPQLINAA